MADRLQPVSSTQPVPRRSQPWWLIAGYFVVFFAALTLGGILFLLGGITIIAIPGSLPQWAEVGYVLLGIVGSVGIALLAANGAFRLGMNRQGRRTGVSEPAAKRTRPRLLAWLAGITGTVLAGVLSATLTTIVTRWLAP